MSDRTRKPRRRPSAARPKKPYPDFPLTPHPSGKWQKKIRGRVHYFGSWAKRENGTLVRVPSDGWEEALAAYKLVADDLHAGRVPRVSGDGLTISHLCNRFLTAKQRKVDSGELGPRMFNDYKEVTDLIVAAFGGGRRVESLAADDFEQLRDRMAKRWGPVRLGNGITRVRTVFRFAVENGLTEKAIRFGGEFKKPDKAVLRRHRAKIGERMIEAADLRRLIDAADVQLRAMILTAVNCGYGNRDVATLREHHLDLSRGWVSYPRPKTGIARRCPLWRETVDAIRAALAMRPSAADEQDAGLVFLTVRGTTWGRETGTSRTDQVSRRFRELLARLGLYRDGISFYVLRRVFRTVADAARDPVAIDVIMGHADPSMGGHYRERVEDPRLKAVVEHVRTWLYNDAGTGPRD